jgi:hypothetical protein
MGVNTGLAKYRNKEGVSGEYLDPTAGLRKLNNEEFHNLYYLANITRMIKSRRMVSAVHIELHTYF